MKITCIWEHNGSDSILYASNLPGASTRGPSLEAAAERMGREVRRWFAWQGLAYAGESEIEIVRDAACTLNVSDGDSDVLFPEEAVPLTMEEYIRLKELALKSAADFLALYESIPDRDLELKPRRDTFYGAVPVTAREMYLHTKNVNAYYFGEIGVEADNDGTIVQCRQRGFAALERIPGFLDNPVLEGSYGELWSLRKMLRRFVWHDTIHGKAMYRHGIKAFGSGKIPDPFCFGIP